MDEQNCAKYPQFLPPKHHCVQIISISSRYLHLADLFTNTAVSYEFYKYHSEVTDISPQCDVSDYGHDYTPALYTPKQGKSQARIFST